MENLQSRKVSLNLRLLILLVIAAELFKMKTLNLWQAMDYWERAKINTQRIFIEIEN